MTQRSGLSSRLPVVRRVERFIQEHGLLRSGDRVLVGVSGGADSVFLLLALDALSGPLGIALHVAHLDHGWRGAEAAADARFVAELAGRLGAPVTAARADTRARARRDREGPEAAARAERYAFFARTCAAHGLTRVATGHTADDQAETCLLALLRGSGPLGLGGMAPLAALPAKGTEAPVGAEGVALVRPLLELTGQEIRRTLTAAGVVWREDATNRDPTLLRTRVRHELLPLMESIAPGARRTVVRSMELARAAAAFLERQAAERAEELFRRDEQGLEASRADLLALDAALLAPMLAQAVKALAGSTQGLEAAHLVGAARVVQRGRGGAEAWLAPGVRLSLSRGKVRITGGTGAPGGGNRG